jgi:nicotinamide riboside transporter PnuC
MVPDGLVLFATIVVLLPMGYFLLAAPAFLLVRLDVPQVALLLRTMFNGYFLAMITTALIGMLAYAAAGRPIVAIAIGLIAACSVSVRRWFLWQMDDQLRAGDAGDINAARKLRHLHWAGMLGNAVLVFVIIGSIPYIAA